MGWYVLQVLTGTERDVCTALRRKGVCAPAAGSPSTTSFPARPAYLHL